MLKVAVIILSYNHSPDTLNCVYSVLNSSFQELDVFVIDNHSPDGSYQSLQQDLPAAANVFLYESGQNLGYAGGMNYGVKRAGEKEVYDFYLLLNNDAVLDKDCLSELVKNTALLGCENVYAPIAYFSRTHIIFCGGLKSYIPSPFQFKYLGWPGMPKKQPYVAPYLSGACFLVSRDLYERVGGLDEKLYLYGEDILFGEQVRALGGSVYMVPAAKFWHEGSKASGKVASIKAYYLSRNIFHLVELLSRNKFIDRIRTYYYLVTSALVALVNLKPKTIRAIFRGWQDYRKGVTGRMAVEGE